MLDGIAGQLAWMPDVVARLLAEHVPDARGRCRGCGFPGTGTPHVPSPCSLWLVAEAASRIARDGASGDQRRVRVPGDTPVTRLNARLNAASDW